MLLRDLKFAPFALLAALLGATLRADEGNLSAVEALLRAGIDYQREGNYEAAEQSLAEAYSQVEFLSAEAYVNRLRLIEQLSLLGEVYPPARSRLLLIRSKHESEVLKRPGDKQSVQRYCDIVRIDSQLGTTLPACSLFSRIADTDSDLAAECFRYAKSPLIDNGLFSLFERVFDVEREVEMDTREFDVTKSLQRKGQLGVSPHTAWNASLERVSRTHSALILAGAVGKAKRYASIVHRARREVDDLSNAAK